MLKLPKGKFGNAIKLNGVGESVPLGKNSGQWLSKTGTLAAWIKTAVAGDESRFKAPALAGVNDLADAEDMFWGWIDKSGHIGIQIGDAPGAHSSSVINDDKWHHIVLTRNATNGEVKVYVDGKLEGVEFSDIGAKATHITALGRSENTNGDTRYFPGLVDEIRLFSRVITPSEVQLLFKGADIVKATPEKKPNPDVADKKDSDPREPKKEPAKDAAKEAPNTKKPVNVKSP